MGDIFSSLNSTWQVPLQVHEQEEAAEDAISAQQAAVDDQIRFQREALETQERRLKPWTEAGEFAVDHLRNELADGVPAYDRPTFEEYQASPWYDYQVGEGVEAMDRSAAARGMLDSGAQRKALNEFGQKAADMDFQNWLNREYTGAQWDLGQFYNSLTPYQSMAGMGQTGQNVLAGLGASAANQMGNAAMMGGQAEAAGAIQKANALTAGLNAQQENMAGIGNWFSQPQNWQWFGSGSGGGSQPMGGNYFSGMQPTGQYSYGNFGAAAGNQIYTGGDFGGGATTAMFM